MFTHSYELLQRRAAQYPAEPIVGGQQGLVWKTLTGRDLLNLTDRLAEELAAEGVRERDRVVLWVPNHWRTPAYLFAIWKLGAISVPFDREMNPEGGARILDAVEPKRIIVGYGERPAWARQAAVLEWWEPGSRSAALNRSISETAAVEEWKRPEEELATLMFTSGTTGVPKGCMITHANLCSQVVGVQKRVPIGPGKRLASILPLSHLLELTGLLYVVYSGAAVHYVPSRRPPDIVRVLSEQQITHMVTVPQLLVMMGRAIEDELKARIPAALYASMHAAARRLPMAVRRRLFWPVHRKLGGHLEMMLAGGAALPAETHRLWERFGVRIIQGYGTSECSPVVTLGAPDGSTPVGSTGKPIRDVELRLGDEGELLVRGPNVMRGYWKDPERTAEVLRDGWYASGDMGAIDAAGNLRIIGRVRDLIVLPSGLLVWPQDVEDVLRAHPAVKDAAIMAVPTAGGGAMLHAYLLPATPAQRGGDLTPIIAESNARLAQHQRLATASWWEGADFPRTALFKVRRHLLPRPDTDKAVRVESVLAADDPVSQAIAGVARVRAVQATYTLGGLGLDSLGLVELALALEEKTGKAVRDGDLHLDMTVEQVRVYLASAPPQEAALALRHDHGPSASRAEQPLWPYTWGRVFRFLGWPIELLYRVSVTETIVLGREHLDNLPERVIFAGTHRGFPDTPLVRTGIRLSKARRLAGRLVPAIAAGATFGGFWAHFGILALGLHPLRQFSERDASLRGLARVAKAGNTILIFPQGTHATLEQELAGDPAVQFKPGVAHLAMALDAVVVPFGLSGTDRLVPRTLEDFKGLVIAGIPVSIKRGPLAVAFAAPMRPEPDQTQAFAARLQEVCFALNRQAEEALGELPRQEVPAPAA